MAVARSLIIVAIAVVLVSVRPVRADEVAFSGPAIASLCPAHATWDQIEACFKRHQWTFTVARSNAHAKLLSMHSPAQVGLALYMQKADGMWSLSGLFETGVETYEVLRFEPITIGHTNGIRIDFGLRQLRWISPNAQDTFESVQLYKDAMFCSGLGSVCSEVVMDCDIFADGREYGAFHGTVRLADHVVDVEGVGTGGPMQCATAEKLALAWP